MSDEDLMADAMAPSYARLAMLHRRLDPTGRSLLSVEQLVVNLLEAYEDTKQRQADDLQGDLEAREAALGRTTSLLRAVWDESGEGTDVVASRVPAGANHWSDVERWIAGEPETEDATVNDKTEERGMEREEVVRRLRAIVIADTKGFETIRTAAELLESRWSGFSDEELRALRAGAQELVENESMWIRSRNLAADMIREMIRERDKREADQPNYRGPGVYRGFGGAEYDVLGVVDSDRVIFRLHGLEDDELQSISLVEFNSRPEPLGQPRFAWDREA